MNKNSIVKYIIGWMIISYGINFFIGNNKSYLNGSSIIRINGNKLIAQKPLECDIDILNKPIYKEQLLNNQENINNKKNIIEFTTESQYYYYFDENFGAPIKVSYKSLEGSVIDILNINDNQEKFIPPLTLTIDGEVVSNFKVEFQNDTKIVFTTKHHDTVIKKEFIFSNNHFSCNTHFDNNNNKSIQVTFIGLQSNSSFVNNKNEGAYVNTIDEGILKFSTNNKELIDQTIILNPSVIGTQSEYTVDSIIAKTKIDRSYYSINENNQIHYYCNYFLPKNQTQATISLDWYAGVKDIHILKKIDHKLSMVMEYGWLMKIASFLLSFILWLSSLVKSFGLAFLIFIMLSKLILIPFFNTFKSYQKKNKELQQKLEYIKVKYHDNPEMKKHEEMLAYQKFGFMPFFVSSIPQLFNFLIIISLQGIMRKNVLLYKMPIGLWLSDAMLPDQYYILPALFLIMLYITINNLKTLSPMVKIAILAGAVLLAYFYSFWSSAMQLFVVSGLIISYIENKLFTLK